MGLGALVVAAAGACSTQTGLEEQPLAAAAPLSISADVEPLDLVEAVPVPPADGPTLAALELASPVYAKPDKQAEKIGYVRIGARVPRAERPISLRNCPGGWYPVRPLGFVCVDEDDYTLSLDHPLVQAIAVEPDRSRPMPYAYAFVRAIAPNYMRIPTQEEQFESEMRLERHLRNWRRLTHRWDALTVGANDVPLDPSGLAMGPAPVHPKPLDMNVRFGGNGRDDVPGWLEKGRSIPNVAPFDVPPGALIANRVQRHAGVALIGSFVADEAAQRRRFAITTDARLIPADKLKVDSGSPFHGEPLRTVGLPVAFSWRQSASFWHIEGQQLRRGARLSRRQFVPLTGTARIVGDTRFVETRDGRWVRSKDVRVAVKPGELPWYATDDKRWIDVSILNQTLVLWEGAQPVYATLVSTGRDGLGDPAETLSTPQGTFWIQQKHVTTTMDSSAADNEFELRDVPWVMYFKGGYALHGAYWHDDFGRPRSHGCVNLSPIDARYVFNWSSPDVPEHWHGAYASESFGRGTLLRIGR